MPKKSIFGFIRSSFSHGAALPKRRAAPAFETLMLCSCSTLLPGAKAATRHGGWRCSRVLHPSEDLSELPPLRSVVAGQEYHYPQTRSLRSSLPKLLLDGWVPLVTLLGRLYTAELYRWSSRILRIAVPFLAHPLDVIQSLDMYFSSCTRRTENDPLICIGQRERAFYAVFKCRLKNFFNFVIHTDSNCCTEYHTPSVAQV